MTEVIVHQLINWMVVACIYTLIAIGFSMLFGVLDVLHFAHGDVSFLSPFLAIGLMGAVGGAVAGASLWLILGSLAVALLGVGVIGAIVYLLIIRPLEARDQLIVLVATVSLGLVIRQGVRHIMPEGATAHPFPNVFHSTMFSVSGVDVKLFVGVAVIATVFLLLVTYWLLNKTMIGLRIRALAQDAEVAQLMGINTIRLALFTFFYTSAIGAVGGLIFAINTGVIRFDYGTMYGILGFSAAVVGGLGSIYGAVIGAVILATAETVAQAVIPHGGTYELVIAFGIVIAFLVFRPTGILGEKTVEKV